MLGSNNNLEKYSRKELEIVKGVIDYADRMIYEEKNYSVLSGMMDPTGFHALSQAPLYKLLRKNAYAKTVVIETEKKGILEFRLSATEAVYPNMDSGYCTPHSTVGRLTTICHLGYEGISKLWGEFRVTEVRSFDRFGGPEFEPNVRNFLQMLIDGDNGKGTVKDLKAYLGNSLIRKANIESQTQYLDKPRSNEATPIYESQISSPEEPELSLPSELIITEFAVIDETEKLGIEIDIEDDGFLSTEDSLSNQEEYYGLSERFFTHQTIEQNQIIARSPVGAMFVEGIAGSGKTSAALGRTKMLTTFDASKVASKDEFYDVLGQDQDYWAADYAGQFSQQGSIGFVRTGELIQYLKETCRRIDLPDLPVVEYKELQTRLLEYRALTRSTAPGKRWAGLTQGRDTHEATTMVWLYASDRAIAKQMSAALVTSLPTVSELSEVFAPEARDMVERVGSVALSAIKIEFEELCNELNSSARDGIFLIDRLAFRIIGRLDNVRKRIMGSKVVWTQVDGKNLYAGDENALAIQLVSMKAALYLRGGQRLVFVNESGPVDHTLSLLSLKGEPMAWDQGMREEVSSGRVVVREASGKNVHAVFSDVNHLYLRLLPEATDRIYFVRGNELHRLQIDRGWGRIKLPLRPTESDIHKVNLELDDEELDTDGEPSVIDQVRHRTPDSEFHRLVRRRVFQPLSAMADLYRDSLKNFPSCFPNNKLSIAILSQLNQFKLDEEDIDLLLCISNLVGRGMKQGGIKQLQEPNIYQSVFVDEVQDFTEQQVYLMVEQANPRYRAVTIVGDTGQKLHHGSSIDLRSCFPGQSLSYVRLSENLRQADMPGLALFSACFRSELQGGEGPNAKLVAKASEQKDKLVRPKFIVCNPQLMIDDRIVEILLQVKPYQTVAVLFPDQRSAEEAFQRLEQRLRENMINVEYSDQINLARRHIRHFSYIAKAKGLEFDVVVLANVDEYDLKNPTQINRLYVGITRARKDLILLKSSKNFGFQFQKVWARYQGLVGLSATVEYH